jgi:hypothetical protein
MTKINYFVLITNKIVLNRLSDYKNNPLSEYFKYDGEAPRSNIKGYTSLQLG